MQRLNTKGNWTGQELEIGSGDIPKALSTVTRNSYRVFIAEDRPMTLPFWAQADPVLRSMPTTTRQNGEYHWVSSLSPLPVSSFNACPASPPDLSAMKAPNRRTAPPATKAHAPSSAPVAPLSGPADTIVPLPSKEPLDLTGGRLSTMPAVHCQRKKEVEPRQRRARKPQSTRVIGAGISKRVTRAARKQAGPISSRTRSRT